MYVNVNDPSQIVIQSNPVTSVISTELKWHISHISPSQQVRLKLSTECT